MPEVFDIWDSVTNTELVERAVQTILETTPTVGYQFAPIVDTHEDRVKKTIIEVGAAGLAQAVARHAAPAIFTPSIDYSQTWIDLVKFDEMSPIEEDEWQKLTSNNDFDRSVAGATILQRARMMQIRYEQQTEVMRWAAIKDNLTIQLAESGATAKTIKVQYDMPSGNKPNGTNWNVRSTSTPITDIRTFQKIPFNNRSVYGLDIYMHDDTFENLQYSKQVADLLKPNDSTSDFFIPTKRQIERLLIGGDVDERSDNPTNQVRITLTNAGYRAEGSFVRSPSGMTFYLPKDYVLILPRQKIEGENVAEVLNGRVAVRQGGEPQWKQGPQNETYASQTPPYTHFTRQVCKRIPRVNASDAVVYAYVGA